MPYTQLVTVTSAALHTAMPAWQSINQHEAASLTVSLGRAVRTAPQQCLIWGQGQQPVQCHQYTGLAQAHRSRCVAAHMRQRWQGAAEHPDAGVRLQRVGQQLQPSQPGRLAYRCLALLARRRKQMEAASHPIKRKTSVRQVSVCMPASASQATAGSHGCSSSLCKTVSCLSCTALLASKVMNTLRLAFAGVAAACCASPAPPG
jgi:hypothetical protein